MIHYIFTALCAVLAATSSLPFSSWGYAIIGSAPLWVHQQPEIFIRSWFIWQLFFIGSILIWFIPMIHLFMVFSYALSISIFILFILALALFNSAAPKLTLSFTKHMKINKLIFIASIISSVILFEYILSEWLLLSWTGLGISQIDGPLSWLYIYSGQYFMMALILYLSWLLINRKSLFFMTLFGLFIVSKIFSHQFTVPSGSLNAAIIQGPPIENIHSLQFYDKLTRNSKKANLIIWPEVTLDGDSFLKTSTVTMWNKYLKVNNQALFSGTRLRDENNTYYNAAVGLGQAEGYYFKHSLVPFGEYLPFKSLLKPVFDFFDIMHGGYNFSPYESTPFIMNSTTVLNSLICYDLAYPRLSNYLYNSAKANLVFNNEYWYPSSLQKIQMINFARLLSIQTQKTTLVSSVTGPSFIVNHQGKVTSKLDENYYGSLNNDITLYTGNTPWELYSSDKWFIIFMLMTFIGIAFYECRNKQSA